MNADQIRKLVQTKSIKQGLALTARKDGESSTQYFQSLEAFESFINRALHLGYTIETIV